MKINIANIGPKDYFDRKSDIIYGLFHALNSIGHETSIIQNQLAKGLNLIIGSDVLAGDESAVQQLISLNTDYVIYEVENFTGSTVNYYKNFKLENYKRLLRNAKFICTPYLHNVRPLVNVVGEPKVQYAKWGFHECMVNNNIERKKSFHHMALFFGLLKGERIEKVNKLQDVFSDKVKIIDSSFPFTIRDYCVSQSKVGLSLSYGITDDFVNPFRLYHMAANGMPILSDHIKDQDGYLHLCENSSFNMLIERIQEDAFNIDNVHDRCRTHYLSDNLREIF